ncbi:hypothetical protein C8R42DRAFT_643844 [Lentinula raphanica]|nr:hypothetical protein C8R42DRAFT_643844 [Lentinula raphanica]
MAILSEDFCAVDRADSRAEVESVAGVGFGRFTTGGLAMDLRVACVEQASCDQTTAIYCDAHSYTYSVSHPTSIGQGQRTNSCSWYKRRRQALQPLPHPTQVLLSGTANRFNALFASLTADSNNRDFNVVNVHTMHDAWTVSSFLLHPQPILLPSISRTRWTWGGGLEDLEDEEQDGEFNRELRPIAASHSPHVPSTSAIHYT